MLAGPLGILVVVTGLTYPLRVFRAVLTGIQDVHFNGMLSVAQAVLSVLLTAVLLVRGHGLYAIAIASAVPVFIVFAAALVRTAMIAPDLFKGWKVPSPPTLRPLVTNGVGVWLSGIGYHLLAASNSLVLTFLGHPEWAVVYACTAKLSAMCTQLVWIPPDSALIGLAQLHGEGTGHDRLRAVVLLMLRLHLLLSGGAACALLAMNPAFVSVWVGPELFAGVNLNVLLCAGIIVYSLVHGLITTASVLGDRMTVGIVVLVNGLVQVPLALVFGRNWGLVGIAAAGLVAAAVTAIPACVVLLRSSTALRATHVMHALLVPWCMRVAALLVTAAVIGSFHRSIGPVGTFAIGTLLGCAYIWHMRPLYRGLPLDPRWSAWLVRARLLAPPVAEPALDHI
jgi:O-antigen/teichoic acid export membrane protein